MFDITAGLYVGRQEEATGRMESYTLDLGMCNSIFGMPKKVT